MKHMKYVFHNAITMGTYYVHLLLCTALPDDFSYAHPLPVCHNLLKFICFFFWYYSQLDTSNTPVKYLSELKSTFSNFPLSTCAMFP